MAGIIAAKDPNEAYGPGKTEWDDILIKKNIISKPDKIDKEIPLLKENYARPEEEKAMEDMTLGELDSLEDDLEDSEEERIMESLRRERMKEMKLAAEGARWGQFMEISEPQFVTQVSEQMGWVVLHLYQDYIDDCKILNHHFEILARKFPSVKFLKIVANHCIRNYPDKNVPTILIYKDKEMVTQIVGLVALRGRSTTVDDLEWALNNLGVVESDMEEDPRVSAGQEEQARQDRFIHRLDETL